MDCSKKRSLKETETVLSRLQEVHEKRKKVAENIDRLREQERLLDAEFEKLAAKL